MSQWFLCFRTFAETLRPCMNIKSVMKNYDCDKHGFYGDNLLSANLTKSSTMNKLLLNAILYRWQGIEANLPDVSDYMASRLNTGSDDVNEKIIELSQRDETLAYVHDFFEANLIPNMKKPALNEALDAVLSLIVEDKTLGKTNIERFKQSRKSKTRSDALFLAEAFVLAVRRKNKITSDKSATQTTLFSGKIDSILAKAKNHKNPFHYLNANLGFYGREKELDIFESFLQSKDRVSILAITGYGGSGKSKFILEAITKSDSKKSNWKFVYLEKILIEDFASNTYEHYQYEKPLCFIIDYAGRYAEKIGMIISRILGTQTEYLPPKLRLVLIERQGIVHHDFGSTIYPDWFQRILKSCGAEIPLFSGGFLELAELPESALKAVALDYRNEDNIGIMQKYNHNETLFEEEWGKISEIFNRRGTLSAKARTIRPLIVLFMIDSSIRNLDYYKWDIDRILLGIIERYEKHWAENLCAGNEQIYAALKKLLMYSTACEPWVVGESIAGLEAESSTLNELGREKLSEILPYVNEFEIYEEKILAFEPDLLGEFFVLKMLKDIASPSRRKEFVRLFWTSNAESFAFFLQMCIDDYSYSKYFKDIYEKFNELFVSDDIIISARGREDLIAGLLLEITYIGVPNRTQQAIKKLASMVNTGNRNENLALRYVTGLYNRISDTGLTEGGEIVKEIRRIADQYGDDEAICSTYCEAMHNFIISEYKSISENDTGKSMNTKLTRITMQIDTFVSYIESKSSSDVGLMTAAIVFYTGSLRNPMLILKRQKCAEYLQIAMGYINNLQVMPAVDEFADALANFSSRDDVRAEDVEPFYVKLKQWILTYERSFVEKYYKHAQILANITGKDENSIQWLTEIEDLYMDEFSSYVAPFYAIALCNFTHTKADDDQAKVSDFDGAIEKIKTLIVTHGAVGISEWYCKALCNYLYYLIDVSINEGLSVANELSAALGKYMTCKDIEDYEDLICAFTDILKVYCEGDESDISVVSNLCNIVIELISKFPQIQQFGECLAFAYMRLVNIYSENEDNEAKDVLGRLKAMQALQSDNELIADYLADSIAAISTFMPTEEFERELPLLAQVYSRFSHLHSIAESYMFAVRNFTAECDPSLIEPWFNKALRIFLRYSDDEELLTNCIDIIDNYLTGSCDTVKSKAMLIELQNVADFSKFESDECTEAYAVLMEKFQIIQEESS